MKTDPAARPCALDFVDISFDDMPFLVRRFREFGSRSCDYSVGGVMLWRDMFHYKWAVMEGVIFLRGEDPSTGRLLYYLPVGNIDREYAVALMRSDAGARPAALVDYSEELLVGEPFFPLRQACGEPFPDWDEYVYDISQFLGFKGKKMEKKRNHLNYFMREYAECEVVDIMECPMEELRAFSLRLDALHPGDDSFFYENRETIDMLTHLPETRMFGIALKMHGDVIGYAYGEVVGATFFAHVEKGDASYRGVYQMLASQMAKRAAEKGARFLNREDDMGSADLRQSKLSYHPVMMIRKRLIPVV